LRAFLREVLVIIIAAIVIFFLLQTTVQKSSVNGYSMEPSLQDGQQLLVNKVVYHLREPERGEIIIFQPPYQPEDAIPFIKRIIGLPGESVEITDGIVYIHKNGEVFPLDEPYIKEPPSRDFRGDIIHEDEYFVLGDNRNNSNDSRDGWTVPRQNIIGKAWLSIWPPGEWGFVPNYSLNEQLESSGSK